MSLLSETLAKYSSEDDNSQQDTKETEKEKNYFEDPFQPIDDGSSLSSDLFERVKKSKSEKKKKDPFLMDVEDFDIIDQELGEGLAPYTPFDDLMDQLMEVGEDEELRAALISQGRKYNQSHSDSTGSSEYEKAFAKQETALNQLIRDLEKDIGSTEKDINNMRLARVRSPKALSDLISVKGSLYSTKLAAIKEINSIKKSVFDLSMRAKKGTMDEDEQASTAASMAIQQLISGENRSVITDGMRDLVKGSPREDMVSYEPSAADLYGEMEAERLYGSDESEGDKYIKYEKLGVELYAQTDDDGNVQNVVARDREGNLVPDYPIPPPEDNSFTIHEDLGTVTDNYHRTYRLEKI